MAQFWQQHFRLLILAAGMALFAGCAGTRHAGHPTKDQGGRPAQAAKKNAGAEMVDAARVEHQAETLARYAAGVAAETQGNLDQALAEYRLAASRDPGNEGLVLEVALRLLQSRQLIPALELLQQSAARTNASALLLAHLGWVQLQAGQTNAALTNCLRAFTLAPTNFLACQTLVRLHLGAQQPVAARRTLEVALRQKAHGEFYIDLAELVVQFNQQVATNLAFPVEAPLQLLRQAKTLPPAAPGYRFKLGDLLAMMGAPKEAAEVYLELLEEFSHTTVLRDAIRAKLTDLYLRGHERRQAMRQLEAIVQDYPLNPQAHYFLGSLAFEEKEYARAAEFFGKTILLNPDFEPAYYDAAAAHLSTNQVAEALAVLERARKKFAPNFTLEYFTGLAHARAKDYDQALRAYTAAEVIARAGAPERLTPSFYFQVGVACERSKRHEEAESYFRKAIELDPDFAEALNYLGYMWAERGVNLEEAKGLLERALKLEPKNAAFLDSLGWIYFKLGDVERAREYVEKAIALSEEPDATLHDHLGDIYAALKLWPKARAEWTKSLEIEKNEEVKKKLEAAPAP